MRTLTLFLVPLMAAALLLGGCGGDDGKAARAQKLKELKAELKAHQGRYVELQPAWLEVRNQLIPAKQAYLRAKGTSEEAAMKEAYEQAAAASQETVDAEKAWNARRLELEDAITAHGG